jgi:hypothetical protein
MAELRVFREIARNAGIAFRPTFVQNSLTSASFERCGSLIFKDKKEENIGVRESLTLQ